MTPPRLKLRAARYFRYAARASPWPPSALATRPAMRIELTGATKIGCAPRDDSTFYTV
ncbi:MAG TPA: hypothetical protein VGK73_00755 [Polyangiaceae bacterium]